MQMRQIFALSYMVQAKTHVHSQRALRFLQGRHDAALQCGRGSSAAEMAFRKPVPMPASCFNGAAVNSPRKSPHARRHDGQGDGDFNGAAVNSPRKSPSAAEAGQEAAVTSMGPR